MWLFSFLKRQKKAETAEIRLEDLPLWIEDRKKGMLDDLDRELSSARQDIDAEKHKFRANLEQLNDTRPGNDKIPERARQIREDNRKSYSQKVMALVQSIKIPEDVSKIREFCDDYDKSLKEFSQATLRNYRVLKEFFANETDAVAANVRNLDSAVKSAQKAVKNSGIGRIEGLERLAGSAQAEVRRRENLSERISTSEDEMKKARESESECRLRIKQIEESSGYRTFMDLIESGKTLEQKLKDRERELFHSFSVIEAALKKYERLTLEDALVRKYLNDPLKALLEDSEMKIVEFAEKMKASIEDGSLELKEAKKGKIMAGLETMTRERFESFLSGFRELQGKLREINVKIKAAEISELNEFRQKLGGLTAKAEACAGESSRLSEELSSIDVDKLKAELPERIVEITGERVSVA